MSIRNILLVESPNDQHVCYALFVHYNVPMTFEVRAKGNVSNVLKTLTSELKKLDDDRLERIGILVDADTDLRKRWAELMHILQRAGYENVPHHPDAEGTIIAFANRPIVGIWLMPDNTNPGELEDFIATLVPHDDGLWFHADQTLRTLIERRFRDEDTIKAHVHTWLAWQSEPGRPMGYAIGRGTLRADAPLAARLIVWINRLFVTLR